MDVDEIVFIVEEDKEVGGYSAVCQRYGIFTQGEDLDDLRKMVKDAVACRFEGEAFTVRRIRLHFVRDEVIAA
jgi:predicted RNase H-like HicB family nuclease